MPTLKLTKAKSGAVSGDDGNVYGYSGSSTVYTPATASSVITNGTSLLLERWLNGSPNYYDNYVALIRFAGVNFIPDDATITAASLVFVVASVTAGIDNLSIVAEWYSPAAWPITTGSYSPTVVADAHSGTLVSAHTAAQPITYALSNLNNLVYTGAGTTYAAFRLHMTLPAGGVAPKNNNVSLVAWDDTASNPQLQIVYSAPAPTASKIDYCQAPTMFHPRRVVRFSNGSDVIFYPDPDEHPTLAVRRVGGNWVKQVSPWSAGFAVAGIAINAAADTGWIVSQGPGTTYIQKLIGNPDGTITLDPTTYTMAAATSQFVDVQIDKNGYVHCFRWTGTAWGYRAFNPATSAWIAAETTGIGPHNVATLIFLYDPIGHKLWAIERDGAVCDIKPGTLTAGGVVTWGANIPQSWSGQSSTNQGAQAEIGADGIIHISYNASNFAAPPRVITFNTNNNSWGAIQATIVNQSLSQPAQPIVSASGDVYLFGNYANEGRSNAYNPGYVKRSAATGTWGSIIWLAESNTSYSHLMTRHRNSYQRENVSYCYLDVVDSAPSGGVYHLLTAEQDLSPVPSSTPSELHYFVGTHNNKGTRMGGLSPF